MNGLEDSPLSDATLRNRRHEPDSIDLRLELVPGVESRRCLDQNSIGAVAHPVVAGGRRKRNIKCFAFHDATHGHRGRKLDPIDDRFEGGSPRKSRRSNYADSFGGRGDRCCGYVDYSRIWRWC